MRIKRLAIKLLTVVFGVAAAQGMWSQSLSSTASLSGTVSDPAGARVPKATITLTDSEKGITRVTTSGSAGAFSFALVSAGTYTLQASAQGFKTSKQTGIVLNAGDALTDNVGLTIGVSEQVTVSEAPALLQTEDANVGTEIASEQVQELPLNLRNVIGLVLLNSSVNNQTQQQLLASGGAEDTADQDMSFLSFGGGFFGTNAFLLDGGWNVASGWGGAVYVPAVDDTQEFKVMNNSFSAEYGWSTGNVVNMITKSGTSDLHFALDEYLRNQKLDANTYFHDLDGIAKTPDHRNQFAASGGGPLYIPGIYKQRDKTFFFANYEGLRLNASGSYSAVVPTTAQEGGDFSAALTTNQIGTDALDRPIFAGAIYNPYTTRQVMATSGSNAGHMVTIRDAYAGNIIPSTGVGAIDSLAAKFASGKYWPAPENPGGGYNFNSVASQATASNEYGIRIDHNINANNRIYGRWSQKFETKAGDSDYYGNDIAGPGVFNPDNRFSVAFGGSHIFSPTFVLNANLLFSRWTEGNNTQGFGFHPSSLGLPAILDSYTPQFPEVGFNGGNYAPLGATLGFGEYHQPNNVGTLSSDLNKIHGPHSLSFGYMGVNVQQLGGRIAPTQFNFANDKTAGPDPTNPTSGTGDAFASFMAGAGTNFSGTGYSGSTGYNAFPAYEYYLHGGYIQDNWKVNRKLTLNLGFRYEVQTPITERHNAQAYFDFHALNPISTAAGVPVNGAIVYSTPGNRDLYNFNYDDVAPRIGFAYSIAPKLVLRGGWGLYYSRNFYGQGPNPGYSQLTDWVSSVDGYTIATPLAQAFSTGILPLTGNGLGGLTNVGQGGGGVNPYHPDPRIKQFMLGFQFAITPSDLLDVDYVGNRGTRIIEGSINYGELDPKYLSMGTALNNPVSDPFTPALQALGLPGMACETSPGSGMLNQAQLLEPYPEFCGGASASQEPVGFSNYNSLQATYTHRVTLGLIFMASYTYSKFLDDAGGPEEWASISSGGATIRNYYDLKADKSVDGTDVPQSLALNYVYELPIGRGKKFGSNMNGIEDAIVGGWQVSGITHAQAGFPLSIGGATANNASLWGGNQHANLVPGVSFKKGTCPNGLTVGTKYCWFNPLAFSQAPAYTFGDAPRYFSNLRAPGYVDEDLGIEKMFSLTEKFHLQFTAQMFNAFNHANFDIPDLSLADQLTTMGQISNTQGARQVQLSLKLTR